MSKLFLAALILYSASLFSQENLTPSEKTGFTGITSYNELKDYIYQLDSISSLINTEVIGQSSEGRNIYALKYSTGIFGSDNKKIKVLIFAQQHGNEQSGKEGALLLARELLKPENQYLFNRIDLALIPQVNPDGSEVNQRRNANNADLNRNHLIMTEPETKALHDFFDKYQFEATLDVHEYSPYSKEWEMAGFRKNSEVTLGTTTNLNVATEIRNFSTNNALPFLLNYLKTRDFTSFVYCPGDLPGQGYTRHSTFDINDGRQSFGIQNTFSFIQEGMNGKDNFTENLKKRAKGQMTGMRGLLEFIYQNEYIIYKMVHRERKQLSDGIANPIVSIQAVHSPNGQTLQLPVYSYKTGLDSVVEINDYRPLVTSLTDVKKPSGYLIPAELTEITAWAERQGLSLTAYVPASSDIIEQYFIQQIDSIDFEGDIIIDPTVKTTNIRSSELKGQYMFIKTGQLKGNLAVIALEPKSMLGLVTYKQYGQMIKSGEAYPILRVTKQ